MKKPSLNAIVSHKARRGADFTPKSTSLRLEALEARELLDAAGLLSEITPPPAVCLTSHPIADDAPIDLSSLDELSTNATTWVVDSTRDVSTSGTLRYALANAQDGDTITFAQSLQGATITLNGTELEVYSAITIDASNLWNSATETPGLTISGNQASGVFYINAWNVTIKGLAITNGSAVTGGGVNLTGRVSFANCAITGNTASEGGGGVYFNSGNGTFTNCVIGNNTATTGSSTKGGGVYVTSSGVGTFTNCTIGSNAGSAGGGVYLEGRSTFTDCVIVDNTSVSNGAGVNLASSSSVGTFTNCSIRGNSTANYYGGGVYNVGTATLTNTAITNNSAYSGGGVYNRGTTTFRNSTVTNNAASYGGGFYCYPSNTHVYNSIVAGNRATQSGADIYGYSQAIINGYNTLSTFNDWSEGVSNYRYVSSAPLFTNASSGDYSLASGSQAINLGNNDYAATDLDLSGAPRVVNGIVDLGAYEYQGTTTPTQVDAPEVSSTATPTKITLSWDAVARATGYEIEFEGTTYSFTAWETSHTFTGLTSGAQYSFVVRAKGNGVAYFDSSDVALTVSTTETVQLAAPIVTSQKTARSITVNWDAVENASGYEIDFNGTTYALNASTRSRAFTGLSPSTTYRFVVRALGDGEFYSNSVDVAVNVATDKYWTVRSVSDSASDVGSLRYLLSVAQDGDTIIFDQALQGETITLGSQLSVSKSVTIDASNLWNEETQSPGVTIDGNQKSRVFYLTASSVAIKGLAITNASGIGVEAKTIGDVSLTNCTIADNSGAGFSYELAQNVAEPGTAILTNCTISGNSGVGVDVSGYGYQLPHIYANSILTNCIINNNQGRGVSAWSTNITVTDCTISGNATTWDGNSRSTMGGGVCITNGGGGSMTFAFANSIIAGNSAVIGGGVSINGGDGTYGTFTNCTISGNSANSHAGGVDILGTGNTSFTDCTFNDNRCTTTISGGGGGVNISGSGNVSFTNCMIANNIVGSNNNDYGSGGGVYLSNSGGVKTFANCTIINNSVMNGNSLNYGGGVYVSSKNGATTFTNCTIANNSVSGATNNYGGGVYSDYYGGNIFTNCSIVGNVSTGRGGGYYLYAASGNNDDNFVNCTIAGNTASGGGDGVYLSSRSFKANFINSIVAKNGSQDVAGTNIATGVNTLSTYANWTNGSTSGVVNYVYDATQPLFRNETNGDYSLAKNSQAINKGNNDYVATEYDLDGTARVVNGTVDLGAYEYNGPRRLAQPTLVVSEQTTDSITVEWEAVPFASSYTLRYAVESESPTYQKASLGASKTSYTIRNLSPNTSYLIYLVANGDGVDYSTSAPSETIPAQTEQGVVTLASPTVTGSATTTTITLNWNTVDNASGYEIDFNGATIPLAASETSYTFTELARETEYAFVVRAKGNGADYLDSADVAFAISTLGATRLAAPTPTSSEQTTTTITVDWETIPNASSYTLRYAEESATPTYQKATLGAGKTSYTLRNLSPNTNYLIYIIANGDGGDFQTSEPSATITVRTAPEAVVLDAPTITETCATASTITVEWRAVVAAGYELVCDARTIANIAADATSYTITGLAANTSYSIKLKALGNGTTTLDSEYSEIVAQRTTALVQLARPVVAATAASASAIDVSWSAIENAGSYTLSYAVKASSPVYTEVPIDPNATSYRITGLTALTNYYVKVRANGDNVEYRDSAQSATATVKTPAPVPVQLARPALTAIATTASAITVSWDAVANASSYVLSYAVKASSPVYTEIPIAADATNYTISGLAATTNYYVKIKAIGDGVYYKDSAQSPTITVKTAAPVPVQLARPALTATATTASAITVAWDAVANASSYVLSYAVKASSPVYTEIPIDANATSHKISGLQALTNYYVKIKAVGDGVYYKDSAQSPTITAKTAAPVPVQLARPALTATATTASSVTVAWDAVANASSYVLSYAIKASSPVYTEIPIDADATNYKISGIQALTNYYVKIKAVGDGVYYKDSAQSPTITAQTAAPVPVQLARPALTATATTASTITLEWDAIANARSYVLSYAVKAIAPVYTEVQIDANATSYTLAGLQANTNYYVKIKAIGDGVYYKDSAQSPTVTARTLATNSNALLDEAFGELFEETLEDEFEIEFA